MNTNIDEKWALVFTSTDEVKADLALQVLLEANISAVKVNKKDSVYLIGDIEVYASLDQLCDAKKLIKDLD